MAKIAGSSPVLVDDVELLRFLGKVLVFVDFFFHVSRLLTCKFSAQEQIGASSKVINSKIKRKEVEWLILDQLIRKIVENGTKSVCQASVTRCSSLQSLF